MNLVEFAKAVNKLVDERDYYRFYLTEWGHDGKDECYFIDDAHHGFMNGRLTLQDKVLEIYAPMMGSQWDIWKAIQEVAEANDITVKRVTTEDMNYRYLESIKDTPIHIPVRSFAQAITEKVKGRTIKEVKVGFYDGSTWIPQTIEIWFEDGKGWWTIDFREPDKFHMLDVYLHRHIKLWKARLEHIGLTVEKWRQVQRI